MRLTLAVVAYGLANLLLYAGLTPLWDGFDEPFHYGYVQSLSRHGSFPIVGQSFLSAEIAESIPLAPASYLVKRNIPSVITFDDYFRLPRAERLELRHRLDHLQPGSATTSGAAGKNYEALQAPLAYLVLAPFDRLLASVNLPTRVLLLRMIAGMLAVLATALLTLRLGSQLGLSPLARSSAIFLLFSCQMFYGSVAHIANDWLAVPLFVLLLTRMVAVHQKPDGRAIVLLGLALGAGLLTKAYFLSAVPVAIGIVLLPYFGRRITLRVALLLPAVCGCIAGPWYIRNLVLYRNLTAMQEMSGGGGLREAMASALHLPWLQAMLTTAKLAVWTGNNSETTFNATTVNLLLAIAAAGAFAYALRAIFQSTGAAERVVMAALTTFSIGLAFAGVLTFQYTHGVGIAPSPWYAQPLFPPCLCLLLVAFTSGGPAGRFPWIGAVWLFIYVICATYLAKFLPLYGGLGAGRASVPALVSLYRDGTGGLCGNLDTVALLPGAVLLCLAGVVVAAAIALGVRFSVDIFGAPASSFAPVPVPVRSGRPESTPPEHLLWGGLRAVVGR